MTTTGKAAQARFSAPSQQNSAGLQLRRSPRDAKPFARQIQRSAVVEGKVVAGGRAQGAGAAGKGSKSRCCIACGATSGLKGRVRFGALESPMCEDCVYGISAVHGFLQRLLKK